MEDKSIFEDLNACQYSCQAVIQREIAIEDYQGVIEKLKQQIIEKDRIINDYEFVKKNIENIKKENIIGSFFMEFEQYLENNTPIYSYIRKRVALIDQIKAVFLYSKEDIYDLWFIIKENDFDLKHAISELFCDIVETFNSILFDIMVLTIGDVDFKKLKEESYKTIYIKE